ncbi:hypothetical protein TRFO_38555 [Tritrichomonas foetus]|uniref:Protein kinase domain-containing protein n=1 Tax=Tritrichomonas foetus TaxID=1144522 RepID=A0A1J4JCG1_9EUKA|nr:hypothetical protein TRFO_38555 [Tritrichomonas foetus]|eukprot:OHS95339.1 hypothetical protein TRFO_38555 [Tritrichomonas foetus]
MNLPLLSDRIGSEEDYIELDEIGNGSFGQIKTVIDRRNNKIYAKKDIEFEREDDRDYFFKEVLTLYLGKIHKNLPILGLRAFLFPSGSNKGFIITKYFENGALSNYIDSNKRPKTVLNDTQKSKIIYGTAFGLAYLHKQSLIHRDIKPSNILLDKNLEPVIADFGFSTSLRILKTFNIGTYMYMAPEIYNEDCDEGKYTTAADVFSFAVMTLEIITHSLYMKGCRDEKDAIRQMKKGNRYKISSKCPENMKCLIEACWKQNPLERMTMEEVVYQMKKKNFLLPNCDIKEFMIYVEKLDQAATSNGSEPEECEDTKEFDF